MTFNLLEEKWISAIYLNGKPAKLNLLDALKDADRLQLAYSNPMDRFAVFRFILALGYWCFANSKSNPSPGQLLPSEWIGWLEDNRQYFELFGEGQRFYQGLSSKRICPTTDLIQELPTGTNLNHLRHVTDYIEGLCTPCCVTGLLRLPVFTTIGGRGLGAGLNNTPPFYAVWEGSSLAEMLLQNWQPGENMGTPAWLGSFHHPDDGVVGLLTGMTWLPRTVHLDNPVPGRAACSACGKASDSLIYRCSNEPDPVPKGLKWDDPHAVYTYDDKYTRISITSKIDVISNEKHNYTFADRDWFRPLLSFFNQEKKNRAGKIWMVGFASRQDKKIDVWDMTIQLSGADSNVEILTQLANRAYSLHTMRKKPRRGDYRKSVGLPQIADIIPHIESSMAPHSGELSENRGYIMKDADAAYSAMLPVVARSIAPDVTVEARMERDELIKRKPWPVTPKGKKKTGKGGQNE